MQKNIRRIVSLLLAVALCFCSVPLSAFAEEEMGDMSSDVIESEEAPPAEPIEDVEPVPEEGITDAPSEEPEAAPEERSPYETEGAEIEAVRIWSFPLRRAVEAISVGAGSVLKIGYNCFANEVGTLPTLGLAVHNLPGKTMLAGGLHVAAYCLDAHLGAMDGTDYTWSSLSKDNQYTIAAILALGFQWNSSSIWSGPSDNADKWAVTQLLVWEAMANNVILQANGLFGVKSGVDADMNKAAACAYNPSGFKSYYEGIKKKLNDFLKIPSFASKTANGAETITLRWDGNKYSATVTDTNGVLGNFPFSGSINGVTVSANGNQLTLSSSSPIISPLTSSRVYSRSAAVGGSGAVVVWRTSDPSQQDCLCQAITKIILVLLSRIEYPAIVKNGGIYLG